MYILMFAILHSAESKVGSFQVAVKGEEGGGGEGRGNESQLGRQAEAISIRSAGWLCHLHSISSISW